MLACLAGGLGLGMVRTGLAIQDAWIGPRPILKLLNIVFAVSTDIGTSMS